MSAFDHLVGTLFAAVTLCLISFVIKCLQNAWKNTRRRVFEDKSFNKRMCGIKFKCEVKEGILYLGSDENIPFSSMKEICMELSDNEIILFETISTHTIIAMYCDGKLRHVAQKQSEMLESKEMKQHANLPFVEGMLVEKNNDGTMYVVKSVLNKVSCVGINLKTNEERSLNGFEVSRYNQWIDEK